MFRSTASFLASLTLVAAAFAPPASAAGEPEVSTSTLVQISDSPKDVHLNKDLRKNKQAVSAAKASDITNATLTITGSGEDAVLEAHVTVPRLLGKKHAYTQAVGLYGSNFQWHVKSDGTSFFKVFRKRHASCAQATAHRDRRAGVVTFTVTVSCVATGLDEQHLDARTFIHRSPKGLTVGGDSTKWAMIDIPTTSFAGVQNPPCYATGEGC